MTHVEYLQQELCKAKTVLARCEGHLQAIHCIFPASKTALSERILRDIAEVQARPVFVVPDHVEKVA